MQWSVEDVANAVGQSTASILELLQQNFGGSMELLLRYFGL